MAKFTKTVFKGADETAAYLSSEIESSALSCTLVEESRQVIGDVTVIVRVFEKYYMRNSSRASLTLVVTGGADECFVVAIGSGGGESSLFKFDWGAADNFVSVVESALISY
ncbi:MAG: hypothetical protein BWY11_02491 [Firmicutes bacterium ADurb.Bin182]|nr:MAG: hypothetical protein BWY11_02491 [Firmicutes bacterium ADurb.Bin182]